MPNIKINSIVKLVGERGWHWWKHPGIQSPLLCNPHGLLFQISLPAKQRPRITRYYDRKPTQTFEL